jgi:hypothetical protein
MNKFKIIILMMLFITSSVYSQHVGKLKLKHCIWKFKDCGQVMIDGEGHKVRGMNYMEYDSIYEMTMYTYDKHVVTVQRTPQIYYYNVLYPDGTTDCYEYSRGVLTDWVFKVFVLP